MPKTQTIKFKPGRTVATAAVIEKLHGHDAYVGECFYNHLKGDWGMVCQEDAEQNDHSLKDGSRVMSVWPLPDDPDFFWIITEGDRSLTTFLLPKDY